MYIYSGAKIDRPKCKPQITVSLGVGPLNKFLNWHHEKAHFVQCVLNASLILHNFTCVLSLTCIRYEFTVVEGVYTLKIFETTSTDAGEYVVVATNKQGEVSCSATVQIEEKPKEPKEPKTQKPELTEVFQETVSD